MNHTTKPLNIIAVDDNALNLNMLVKPLKYLGHHITSFLEGDIAWEYLQALPKDTNIDLILLDRMMDTIDGLTLLKCIKEHPWLKHIPVIIQSGLTEKEEIQETLDAGAAGYLTKPFSAPKLIRIVEKVVANK